MWRQINLKIIFSRVNRMVSFIDMIDFIFLLLSFIFIHSVNSVWIGWTSKWTSRKLPTSNIVPCCRNLGTCKCQKCVFPSLSLNGLTGNAEDWEFRFNTWLTLWWQVSLIVWVKATWRSSKVIGNPSSYTPLSQEEAVRIKVEAFLK